MAIAGLSWRPVAEEDPTSPPHPRPDADPKAEPLEYQSLDLERHTESAAEMARATVIVFVVIGVIIFLVCGGCIGMFRAVGGVFGF
jgi:hypothetical protein